MNNADVLKILNKVGEDFGWQMGKVGSNYENGYMKAIRDCKAVFLKEDHIVEVNKKVVSEEKMGMLQDCVKRECESEECYKCTFYNPNDKTKDGYKCSIRDKEENVPYYNEWNIESALGEKVE